MTKQSNLALLLSAFAFPGAGQIYLKKYITGILLAGTALLALYFIISKVLERAQQIADKILLGEVPLDISVITELVTSQSMTAGDEHLNYAWAALFIAWLVGIADTYRLGRLKSKADTAGN
jgi:hypothetical protein